jgi:hypothetical protein
MGTLREDVCTLCSVVLRLKYTSDKSCTEYQNTHGTGIMGTLRKTYVHF